METGWLLRLCQAGPQLLLVVLNLDKELQLERLKPRVKAFGDEMKEAFDKI